MLKGTQRRSVVTGHPGRYLYNVEKHRKKMECEKLGAVHFITKPTSFNERCRVISNVLYREMIIHD